MAIAKGIKGALASSSMIRKMFEEGIELKKKYGQDKVFDFSLGNPDIEPPDAFHKVFVNLANEDAAGSHGYMPNAGYSFVREALSKKVSREHNVNAVFSDIVMCAGAAGGLNVVFKAVCNQDDEVIVTRPYFMEYRAYTANCGARLVEVEPSSDFDLDILSISAALNEKTAAVLINSPNNPTGKIYSADTLSKLSVLLREHGKKTGRYPYLVSDEPYREITYGTQVPPVLCAYNESIVVSSYSKNLSLPGERIGYIAVNPAISEKDDLVNGLVYATRTLGYVNAPALMQKIVALLTDASVDVSIYSGRRDAFTQALDKAGIEYIKPEGAFYLFCKVPPGKAAQAGDKEFAEHLKKYLILGVPGSAFGKSGYIRFAYCVDERIIRASADAFKAATGDW
jgi:aspartate aminotransferase